jgi:DNA polymerase III sliding clamp (beta) subunit (PCNA family)
MQTELKKALDQVGSYINKRSWFLPRATLIFADKTLTLETTDGDARAQIVVPCQGEGTGTLAVPFKDLIDLVKSLPKQRLDFLITETTLKVETGFSTHTLQGYEEYPEFPIFGEGQSISFDEYKGLVAFVTKACAVEDNRPVLTGVFILGTAWVGCDGYRMHRQDCSLTLDSGLFYAKPLSKTLAWWDKKEALQIGVEAYEGMIIKHTTTKELGKWVTRESEELGLCYRLHIWQGNKHLAIENIQGQYPDYASIFPRNDGLKLVGNVEALKSAFLKTLLVAQQFANTVTVERHSIHAGKEPTEAQCEVVWEGFDEPVDIAINNGYMLELLDTWGEPTITMHYHGSTAPLVFSGSKQDAIIMPMSTGR